MPTPTPNARARECGDSNQPTTLHYRGDANSQNGDEVIAFGPLLCPALNCYSSCPVRTRVRWARFRTRSISEGAGGRVKGPASIRIPTDPTWAPFL